MGSSDGSEIDMKASAFGDQVVLAGEMLRIYNFLDSSFKLLAKEFRPKEHMFPSFIDVGDLRKMDYLHSFPQHATFAATLEDDPENLESFRQSGTISDNNVIALTKLAPTEKLLTPAACYHCYITYQGKSFDTAQYFTTRCTCYRREKEYVPLERQWNFTMREFICIGTFEETTHFVDQLSRKMFEFCHTLELDVDWEVASDPFFDPDSNPKSLMQKIQPNKRELVFDSRLAIASTNIHRNYFGEIFDIQRDGVPAYSACVAFGMERWLSAVTKTKSAVKDNEISQFEIA